MLQLKQSYAILEQDLQDQNGKDFSPLLPRGSVPLQLHLTTVIELFTVAHQCLILCLTVDLEILENSIAVIPLILKDFAN